MSTVISADTTGFVTYDPMPAPGRPIGDVETVVTDPAEEYLAGGPHLPVDMGDVILPEQLDDLTRMLGAHAYDIMSAMPAINRALRTLKLSIMAGEIAPIPTHPIKAGAKEDEADDDQKASKEVADFIQRNINRVPGFRASCMQLLDAIEQGNKLAEITAEVVEGGDDDGLMMLKSLNVKRRSVWQFVVDRAYNVTGILGRDTFGKRRRYPAEKFLWLSWFPKDNDPRGSTVLRACYAAWAFVVRLFPQYLKFMSQFAVPSLIIKMGPNAMPRMINGQKVSPEKEAAMRAAQFQNGSYLILPNGTEADALEVAGEGGPFTSALRYLAHEMISTILLNTRATEEAEFGSRADAQQGGDILDLIKQYGQQNLGEVLRIGLFKKLVAFNYGPEWAEKYTSYIGIGSTDASDFVARVNALANLLRANGVPPSIEAEVYVLFGLPAPDREADEAAAQAAFERAQANAERMPGGDDDEDDDDPRDGDIPENVERRAA